MEREFLDLFEFQTRLKEGIECLFPKRLWVRAEISAVKARSGGHCYLELSQSNEGGLIAKASAIVWASKYRFISPYFESVTGSALSEGMLILAEVQPNYSQLYGFSLIINDIDPEYTLGAKEMEKQKTIERLSKEGLMELQKELALPLLPYNFAVISAEDAAGYRDFIRHLDENPYGFRVNTELYPALMQGADCPSSIIDALGAIIDSGRGYDAVLILRGGGSKLDLACFDDYELAAHIAQLPLPVLTAIGHDQDFHVCDMIAHEFVKTPTALADYILEFYEDEDARLSTLQTRMKLAFAGKLSAAEAHLSSIGNRVKGAFAMKLTKMEAAIAVLEARIGSADPRKILQRGYALPLDSAGLVIREASGCSRGDKIFLLFADGRLDCTIDEVNSVQ